MGNKQIGARATFLVISCLLLPSCLSVDEAYPVKVRPHIYVLLMAPVGTRLNPEVLGPASERAAAFCQKSDEQMIVVNRQPYTVVKNGEVMDVMYFACSDGVSDIPE